MCCHLTFSAKCLRSIVEVNNAIRTTETGRSRGFVISSLSSDRDHSKTVRAEEYLYGKTEAVWDFCHLGRVFNERIGEHFSSMCRGERLTIVCECGNPDCETFIRLPWHEYQKVLRRDSAFIVAHGHQATFERVLSEHGTWLMIEKRSKL